MASQQPSIPQQFSQLVLREERLRRLINVMIEPEGSAEFPAIVTNLSVHGMAAKTASNLHPFDLITVNKPGYGRIRGEVRWADGTRFGVLFAEPVNVELFNFSEANGQGHFVQPAKDGHVWTGFKTDTSIKRPGVTNQFAKAQNPPQKS